jgi:hypothetical protein
MHQMDLTTANQTDKKGAFSAEQKAETYFNQKFFITI